MFKHYCGWHLNARILRLVNDHAAQCIRDAANNGQDPDYLFRIVREEIREDRNLVWC